MKIGASIIAAGFVLTATAALAEPTALAGDELKKAISGKTVFLNISGFELPISYSANGRMSGKMSTIAASFSRGDGTQDQRQMVGRGRSALPAMVELDGRQILLLQADARRRDRALDAQRRPLRYRPHRRLSATRIRDRCVI